MASLELMDEVHVLRSADGDSCSQTEVHSDELFPGWKYGTTMPPPWTLHAGRPGCLGFETE